MANEQAIKDDANSETILGANLAGETRVIRTNDTGGVLTDGDVKIKDQNGDPLDETYGAISGLKVHVVGDGDKYVRGNVAEGAAVSDPVYIGGRDASGNVYGIRTGQQLADNSLPIVLTAAQITTLTPPAAITGFATSAKQDTLLTELQAKADLTETQPVQEKPLPLATNVSSTLTLTNATTAYQITEPASAFLVTYCNNSDTDMYWGFATLTTGGILLAKNGGVVTLKCAANNSPFFYCGSAGKVLNYTTTVL